MTICCGISMRKRKFSTWRPSYWVAGTRSCSWLLLRKGFYWFQVDSWLMSERGSGQRPVWPQTLLDLQLAFLQLLPHSFFLHVQRAPISCHGLVLPHWGRRRLLPFIIDFRGSGRHSMHCRLKHLISLSHDLQEKMFINTWHLMSLPRAHSCTHLFKSSLVAPQAPAEIVLTT